MAALIAKRYATALFQAVQESETTDAATVLQELQGIYQAMLESPDFDHFFSSPVIGDTEKKQFINEMLRDKVSLEVIHFLLILVDKGRESFFRDMVDIYQQLTETLQNRMKAVAVTAVPMSEESRMRMMETLGTITGMEVTLENQVDETIVGGAIVRMGDRVIDGSIRNRLSLLKEELMQMIV
jgi:F-type H+-transporting ATPase subunit delta